MYESGELIIFNRVGTRKIYDFSSNYIPENILNAPDPNKKDSEFIKWLVFRRISSVGLLWNRSGDAWLGFREIGKTKRSQAIKQLINENKITKINIEGIETPFYIRSDNMPLLNQIKDSKIADNRIKFIAPLDNLIWDRRLIKKLFNFDYVWEVYKPVKDRQFGYYVLPVLHNDKFIARFEPEFNKKKKELIIKNWWWEPDVNKNDCINPVKECLNDFMEYLGAIRLSGFNKIIH